MSCVGNTAVDTQSHSSFILARLNVLSLCWFCFYTDGDKEGLQNFA